MGISDEIEDATIAIDETKISGIEATISKEIIAFRQNISQLDLKKLNMKMISHLIHNQT